MPNSMKPCWAITAIMTRRRWSTRSPRASGWTWTSCTRTWSRPEIQAELDKNLDLGRALDISGTPGFVIGDQIFAGATTIDDLKKYVADACKDKG